MLLTPAVVNSPKRLSMTSHKFFKASVASVQSVSIGLQMPGISARKPFATEAYLSNSQCFGSIKTSCNSVGFFYEAKK